MISINNANKNNCCIGKGCLLQIISCPNGFRSTNDDKIIRQPDQLRTSPGSSFKTVEFSTACQ